MPDARITLSVDNADLAVALVEKVGDAITRAGAASVSASAQSDTAFNTWASTTTDRLHPALESLVPALSFMKDGLEGVGTEIKDLGDKVTEGLEHPLDTAKEAVKGVLEELGPLGVGITAVATAATAAGAAELELAEHAAEAGEAQLQFSRVTGESIEKVGGLSAAATIAGGSLDGMQSMLTQMQRRLDAGGPAADKLNAGLADLGINAEAFRAADPTERIAMLAEGMQASAGKTTLMSDALAVMGRSGVQNIGFLMEYTDEAREKGEALGLTLSQTEAQGAVELGIATRTTGVELSTMANTIGVELIPATTVAVEGFNRTILALEHIADLGGLVSGGWHLITGAVGETAAAEQTAGAMQDDVNRKWADAAARGLDLSAATYDVADKMLKVGYSVQTVAEQTGLSTEEVKGLAKAMKDAAAEGDHYADVWQRIGDAEAEAGRVDAPLSASLKGQVLDYQALGFSVQDIATALNVSTGAVTAVEVAHTKAAAAVDKHKAAVDAIKASIEGDSKATTDQVQALDQLVAAGITDEDVKTRAVAMIDKLEAKQITLTDRTYEWSAAVGGSTTAADKYGMAWANLASIGSDYADTVAQIDPLLVGEIADFVEAGAKVSDLAAAYADVLTPAQVDAIDKMVKANDKYAASWVKTQDDIDRVWDRALLTQQENDLRGLDLQLAKLNQQEQNEKDAASKRITDETQLEAMLEAIDADYDSRRANARRTNDQKLGDQLTIMWQGVYDAEAAAGETASEKQISAVQKWYDAEVDKAIKAGVVDQAYYDNLWALADRKTKDVIALNDPWAKANQTFRQNEEKDWQTLYGDIYGGWVDTFDQTLLKTGSFKDAASAVFKELETAVEKVFADTLTNILQGFFAPLEAQLGGLIANITGLGSGSGSGGGSGVGSILSSIFGGGGPKGASASYDANGNLVTTGGNPAGGAAPMEGAPGQGARLDPNGQLLLPGDAYASAGGSSGSDRNHDGQNGSSSDTGYFAGGGIVPAPSYLARGGFPGAPRGTDVTPVWATPGEMFINASQQHALFTGTRDAIQAMHTSVTAYHREIKTLLQQQPYLLRHALRGR